ncbi:hypothetical protein [Roseicyclus persicicus]|uniref:Uncharacterized protein n=1 Tax=Roseicyclus persicicus TaxID=2650661 RepID=A0A7X6GX87_9RHOB|nr:hypothetical protein [Roseibacterium persicicum]NKX44064.1 hypothetical protein [Roseibacterium persicicum]
MQGWLERHAPVIQAGSAVAMAAAALAAAVFVPMQIAANERTAREQAAREIYREFLNISIQRAEFARSDVCLPDDPVQRAAYESYVDYLLYTAEQVLDLSAEDWEPTIAARLAPHQAYLCSFAASDLDTMTAPVAGLVAELRADCPVAERPCS